MWAAIRSKCNRYIRCALYVGVCAVYGLSGESILFAEEPPTLVADDFSSDLDSLLDMADKDVSQLSRVNVSAPSLQTEVTSVSRQLSTVGRSPAAIFVITNEMIRNSGARNVPDVLRMAPGIHVARINASTWSISIRGFSGRFAAKLLVQIDGRSVYTPFYGGTQWDIHNVLLEDVERIEIIRGPGATVWGANAVNGIINIITKKTDDTHGVLVQGGAGTEEKGFLNLRLGGKLNRNTNYRIYGQGFDRDDGFDPSGDGYDAWHLGQVGGRIDSYPTHHDHFTLQGDYHESSAEVRNQSPFPSTPFSATVDDSRSSTGGNALARWTHKLDDESSWTAQLYYDRVNRNYEVSNLGIDISIVDVDFTYRFAMGENHSVIVGTAYRNVSDRIRNAIFSLSVLQESRVVDNFSYFIQDEVTLLDDELYFTLGSKFSHDDYTQFEIQPTARILWTPNEKKTIWASVSRAVRSPTRADNDLRIITPPTSAAPGVFPTLFGNNDVESEDLLAFEFGMRAQPVEWFSWDIATFYNRYDDLFQFANTGAPFVDPGPPSAVLYPLGVFNTGKGKTYGAEFVTNLDMTSRWRLYGMYSCIQSHYATGYPGSGQTPNNQLYFQSSWEFASDWQLGVTWRYVDSIPGTTVSNYNTMDVLLAWEAASDLKLALVGRNLLDPIHDEYSGDASVGLQSTEVERSIYGTATWKY